MYEIYMISMNRSTREESGKGSTWEIGPLADQSRSLGCWFVTLLTPTSGTVASSVLGRGSG